MLSEALERCGLIAILRGIGPDTAVEIAQVLYAAGFRVIEVPLNSPQPLQSIRLLRDALQADCIVGAGTVYRPEQVNQVKAAGGSLIVMPHCDRDVIRAARSAEMEVIPGVATPSEAFSAFASGATRLKVFPADYLGPAAIKAWCSVLPREVGLIPVGGVQPDNLSLFAAAGAVAFGVGSALYKPDMTVGDVAMRAKEFVRAVKTK